MNKENRKEIRRLYKLIRENLKEFNELSKVKDVAEVESIYRWCRWISNDCFKLIKLMEVKNENKKTKTNDARTYR